MTNLLKKTETLIAAELGKAAFNAGKAAVASWDKDLMEMINGSKVGEKTYLLEAWIKAWHKANISALTA